jgi:hypothetical protein
MTDARNDTGRQGIHRSRTLFYGARYKLSIGSALIQPNCWRTRTRGVKNGLDGHNDIALGKLEAVRQCILHRGLSRLRSWRQRVNRRKKAADRNESV